MPSNYLILCHPFLLLSSIFLSIKLFSSDSALCIRWPKYWSLASASVLPINIQSSFPLGLTGLISMLSKRLSRVFSSNICQNKIMDIENRLVVAKGEEVGEGWSRRLVIFILKIRMWLQLLAWIFVDWIQIEHFTTLSFLKILQWSFLYFISLYSPRQILAGNETSPEEWSSFVWEGCLLQDIVSREDGKMWQSNHICVPSWFSVSFLCILCQHLTSGIRWGNTHAK